MKFIYTWVAILVVAIVVVGLFVIQMYTMPRSNSKIIVPKMRINLAEKYEQRVDELSDSAISMANRIRTIQGSLTPEQEQRINRLLERAKELKANAGKIKDKTTKETEANTLLRSCYAIYGEASGICRQLEAEARQKNK